MPYSRFQPREPWWVGAGAAEQLSAQLRRSRASFRNSHIPTDPPSSCLALGPRATSTARQTGSALAWSTVPALIVPRAAGTACACPRDAAAFVLHGCSSHVGAPRWSPHMDTDGSNTSRPPRWRDFTSAKFIHISGLALLVLPACKLCYSNM